MKSRTTATRLAGLLLIVTLMALPVFAAQNRVVANPDLTTKVTMDHTVSPIVAKSADAGRLNASQSLGRIILTLAPTSDQEEAARNFIRDLHDTKSPSFHKWLTPAQFGDRFGVTAADAAQVKSWLESQGLTVHEVSQSRRFITFSGNVAAVEKAFGTQLHSYTHQGKSFIANASPVQLPAGLKAVIKGVNLAGTPRQNNLKIVKKGPFDPNGGVTGLMNFNDGSHFLSPADFATIYNVKPLWASGYDGTGQTIAIVGRTNIDVSDVNNFRAYFGLPYNPPTVIINGDDPGVTSDEVEALLDVEWSGAVAPRANVTYVASASNFDDGVSVSATYIVDHALASVMSTSYGECEYYDYYPNAEFWYDLWEQASAEGITAFVSSGDNGGAGCDSPGAGTLATSDGFNGFNVNGIASTPYNVAVGGTQFDDNDNPSTYWSPTYSSATKQSVLSYIPEKVWNESSNDPNSVSLWAGSGGASSYWFKPEWQIGTGINDGMRDLPDVSLAAAGHDGYLIAYGGYLYSVGGTSAASPSFAGLMAIVDQAYQSPQGQANYVLYQLASGPSYNAIFHDTTKGDNKVPGTTGEFIYGYAAATGYDMATGWGSVDATQLVQHWGDVTLIPSQIELTATCDSNCTFQHGQGIYLAGTVSGDGTSTPSGASVVVGVSDTSSPSTTSKPTAGSNIVTGVRPTPHDSGGAQVITGGPWFVANGQASNYINTLPGGTWDIFMEYSGNGTYLGSTSGYVTVTVTPEDSNTVIGPLTGGWQVSVPVQLQYGESLPTAIYVYGNSGYGYPSGLVYIGIDDQLVGYTTLQYGEVGLSQQSSTFFTLQGFPAGAHTVEAVYPGDASFNRSESNVYNLNVSKADTYIYGYALQDSALVGTPFTLGGYVALNNSGYGTMDGNVAIVNISNPASPVTLATVPVNPDGSFAASVTMPTAGTYVLQAQFLGSANLNPSSYKLGVRVNNTLTPTVAVSGSMSIAAGGMASFSATVTATAERTPTGTVTFYDGSTSLGSSTLASGTATLNTSSIVTRGTHIITASYNGDTYYGTASSSSNTASPSVSLTVSPATSNTTLATSSASIVTGNSVTLTATVGGNVTPSPSLAGKANAQLSLPTPTGSVTFNDGSTTLGTATLDASGKATLTTSSLAIGSHAITASYGGDLTYTISESAALAQVVTGVPDYSIQVLPSNLQILGGQDGTALFNVIPVNGYKGTITFTCTNLPAKASCVFSPTTVTLDGSNKTVTSTLTVHTSDSSLSVAGMRKSRWMTTSAIAFAGVLFALPFGWRKRRWGAVLAVLMLALVAFAASCGGGYNSHYAKPGTYSVSVQAGASAGGSTSKTANLTITII